MIDILTDTATTGGKIKRYIQRHMVAYGYCSVDEVAQLSGVRAVQVSEIGWPLRRIGWLKMPEIALCKDSEEDFWKIQIDDPVRLDSFNTFKTKCQNRPFFAKSPNGTWEPISERIDMYPVDMYPSNLIACDGFRGGKIYDVKTIHKEDIKDMMDATTYFASIVNQIKELDRKRFETSFTPKFIEQSADHKTVCVLWQDGSKTIVKLSNNDKDDIDTAFAYALAKKIFGTNTHLKKVVRQKLNEHKPKTKKLPSDPNPKEIPMELKYVKAAKELFLESHLIYDVQIGVELMDTGEIRVHMYNSREGIIEYMKNVESTQDALSKFESMWQQFNTEKENENG